MNDKSLNIIVGLTVLVALCILAIMIVMFVGVPEAISRGYKIRILFDATQNANTGDPVRLSGMRIGSITDIMFTEHDARKGVTFIVLIDRHVRVPADVTARIQSQGFVGSAYIDLAPGGEPLLDQDTGQPLNFIPTDRTVTIRGESTAKGGMIPVEITEALSDMRGGFKHLATLAENFNRMFAPTSTQPSAQDDMPSLKDVLVTIAKVGKTFDELNKVIGDEDNQTNLKAALAGFAQAGEETSSAMASVKSFAQEARASALQVTKSTKAVEDNLDELTQRLIGNAEQISALMATINKTVTKMESGKGTLGKLTNDPRLYNNFAEAAEQLNKLVGEMRQLVKTWQSQGVGVKLK